MHYLNTSIAWREKGSVIVVYQGFNFYFYKGQARLWLKHFLTGQKDEHNGIPKDFINSLYQRNILCHGKN